MSKALATKNVAAVLLGLGLVLSFAFAVATPAKADAVSDLQAQVQALLAQITSLQGGSTTSTTPAAGCYTFTRNHSMGNTGGEVMWIQQFLNTHGAVVAATGAGSPGMESSYFGAKTKAAVAAWQAANGVSPASGYWGPLTRAAANAKCAGSTTGGTTGGTTPTGAGITVAAAAQPANSLAPKGAVRVPFTNFTLTNNSGAAVTVNGVTVERTGLGQDAAFAGVVLVDSSNVQIGTSKTLNSNHQAVVGDVFTLMPGETKTLTVAGNMATPLTSYTGQVVGLSVVGVNTTATVSGSLPITGAQQTLNDTLAIGTVTTNISSFDPNGNQSKNIGDTALKFTGVRFTADSAEDLKLYSVRFRQVGSVSSSDLANVVVILDGVSYSTMVSTDGKYYTATFPGGILIQKGYSKDLYIQGDIVGGNASGRYAEFDIDKKSDVYLVGQLYGYGISPANGSGTLNAGSGATASNHATNITATQPWFQGSTFNITGASVTTVAKANEVAAQNIAINVPNQVLGGYVFDLKGEDLSVQTQVFHFNYSSVAASSNLLTSVSLVDENGAVVAGPVDAVNVGGTEQKVTFSDTVTYKTGRHVYTLKGKLPSTVTNNQTIAASTTPSSDWTNVTGATTGNTVSLSTLSSAVSMNTMTVKTATLAVSVSGTPVAQTIVAGGQGTVFANIKFDASQSGEDVRFSSFALTASTSATGMSSATALATCQAYDGTTVLNSGSNVVNPSLSTSAYTAASVSFTLDNSVVVAKGTSKTLAIKCNIASGATGSVAFGITGAQITALSATGVTSSNTVTATGSGSTGQVQTLAGNGSVVVSTDSSSPSYALVAGGSTGNVIGVYKFRASNEAVNLSRIGVQLTNAASSTANDLSQVTLWANGVQIGSASFSNGETHATSTLSSILSLPKDTDVVITVKGDIAAIGPSAAGTTGHLVAVDVDNSTNTQGTGASSGATINATGSTSVAGVRIFRSMPSLAKDVAPTNTLSNGTQALLRFKVIANSAGDVGVGKVTIQISTTTVNVTGINVFAFTDASYGTPVSGVRSDGALLASDVASAASDTDINVVASTPVQVPMGQTRYFEVRGTVAGLSTTGSVQTKVMGDAAFPSLAGFDDTLTNIDGDTNDDFIWSPNTDGTTAVGTADWTNGFGLIGLPASNMAAEVLSK